MRPALQPNLPEYKTLIAKRVERINRIKRLLFAQASDYERCVTTDAPSLKTSRVGGRTVLMVRDWRSRGPKRRTDATNEERP
ncbi:hypothetical protein MESS2_950008 [Mesorhizobium metallidurans STM 2683]|uniref:Uncharacterized protein n=1 Tax=Mesorhizobium metallidurans STM 2683 TaxID=1297569 RepID=M5EYW6_9HYPH|nr:hypothetical protein MESS2_950008 [Mesorhizobium metallidurans STM 2683]